MHIRFSHLHKKEEARRRVQNMIREYKDLYEDQIHNFEETWVDYTGKISGTAKGYSVSGIIKIDDNLLTIDLTIPLVLRIFSKKIKSLVEEKLKKELS